MGLSTRIHRRILLVVLRKSPSGVHHRLARQRDARGGTKELTEYALDDTPINLGIPTLVVSDREPGPRQGGTGKFAHVLYLSGLRV